MTYSLKPRTAGSAALFAVFTVSTTAFCTVGMYPVSVLSIALALVALREVTAEFSARGDLAPEAVLVRLMRLAWPALLVLGVLALASENASAALALLGAGALVGLQVHRPIVVELGALGARA